MSSHRVHTSLQAASRAEGLFEVRVVEHRPIAKNQWAIWVKREGDLGLPDFQPGNFCMLSLADLVDPLTPRPFAIVEKSQQSYLFIYRVTGKFTRLLTRLTPGSKLGLLGPLGVGVTKEHLNKGKHAFVAGGVGYASLLPLIDELAKKNPKDTPFVYYGVREELEVIRRGKFPCRFASDNGSIGHHGRINELVEKESSEWAGADWIYVCGPTAMMKALFPILPKEKTFYFLEEAMGCGVGICMGCVVTVLDSPESTPRRARSCLEGPIFPATKLTEWAR